jgi:hypothetical protein
MNYLRGTLVLLLLCCNAVASFGQQPISLQSVTNKQHPRILLLEGEERLIVQSIADQPVWKKMH